MIKMVFSFNSELHTVSGVQKVVLSIHNALKDEYSAKVVGLKSYSEVNPNLGIKEEEYVKWRNPFFIWQRSALHTGAVLQSKHESFCGRGEKQTENGTRRNSNKGV